MGCFTTPGAVPSALPPRARLLLTSHLVYHNTPSPPQPYPFHLSSPLIFAIDCPLQDAEKEDYEEKLKEVQDICGPIVSKVYAASGGAEGGSGGEEEDLGEHDEL